MNQNKIANPIKFYKHPNEVMEDKVLSNSDKIKVLESWLDDIKLKLIAEDEGMCSTLSKPKYYVAEINCLLTHVRKKN
ncbi:hypothetical protein [Legionella parisiensis]|uniref:Uncharacterized protein n=1 Tax=Legionella parisiensis TaxID=45071 RepID=A0A1E5JWK9_9GAMM|nr:hypothetical protein [Legionella parisiensis]KTD42222.1 hypothetical protein Lpar_3539 [Legionella parisiensis]OEH48891.1 hypothetical protein lpari_00036 [Legionella parisiensis]STX72289.1 Uncharacterised protein [Legionella parisiensis]